MNQNPINQVRLKKAISIEGFIMLIIMALFFVGMSVKMDGPVNFFNTMMNTAFELLIDSVFYIMGIAVLAGAFGALISEFGVVSIINKGLSKVMKPLYNLPGAAAIGVVTTYLSDNPAILTLAKDKGYRNYFKRYQLPALTNLGTSFGMGLVVTTFMIAQAPAGQNFVLPAIIGNIGAIIGSIISVRLMIFFTKRFYGPDADPRNTEEAAYDYLEYREIRQGSIFERALDAILEGGKSGVEMGLSIIPGVLIICTFVMMLTYGPSVNGYTGGIYEGVALLPYLADKIDFIIQPLFGFQSPEAIAFPITAIGAVGAAIGLVPTLLTEGLISANDIAVFTAIGMCWSGYLSTHVAMMDGLNARSLTSKAILSHTIGGLVAGIVAHFLFLLFI
jgi:hypothetical protein